jgi:hypothetical protein
MWGKEMSGDIILDRNAVNIAANVAKIFDDLPAGWDSRAAWLKVINRLFNENLEGYSSGITTADNRRPVGQNA